VRRVARNVLLSKGRMEALTDGIFAISMTLLVLELKIPDTPRSITSHELLHKLGEEIPAFFSFFVSFIYCGLLWTLHHLAAHFFRHIQLALVWLNLLFLMTIALLPFSCALLGHFLGNVAAGEIYFGNMLAAAILLALQWQVARRKNLISEDEPQAAREIGQQLLFFPPALAAGMVVTPFNPKAGFYAMAAVLLSLRIWQRVMRRRTKSPSLPPSS
jgi:uncharacterized membrane protein